MNIDQISQDGFYLTEGERYFNSLAFLSARTAIRSYFATYDAIRHELRRHTTDSEENDRYGTDYIENACQAITSFQHFVELVIKDILASANRLLAIDAHKHHVLLYDLLSGAAVNEAEFEQTKQLEFYEALDRICALIQAGRIDANKYRFLSDSRTWLKKLAFLRNRIAHRGIFVLRYKALDQLFSAFALPFFLQVVSLPEYGKHKVLYRQLAIGIDPVAEIISCGTAAYDATKMALLKELGRAAFSNPITGMNWIDRDVTARTKEIVEHVVYNEYNEPPVACPVCGEHSLVRFNDSHEEMDDKGETINMYPYIYRMECFCCTFHLEGEVSPLTGMGLPIADLWH